MSDTRNYYACQCCGLDEPNHNRAITAGTNPEHKYARNLNPRYNDWRDGIATEYSTLGPIPEHPFAESGLWVDSGIRTADDALRAVIEIAESWGWDPLAGSASEDRESHAELLAESGWVDLDRFPDGPDILVDIADAAESFINAVLSAYGFDPEPYRGYLTFGDDIHPNHPLVWYAGWDGDIGGFGLWVVPDDEWDETNAEHVWGELERSPIAGTVHRKCVIWGCRAVNALDDPMSIGCVICGREPSIGAIGDATYCGKHGLAVLRGSPPVMATDSKPADNLPVSGYRP